MKTQSVIFNKVMDLALFDERVRAVLLNGSRADPNIPTDEFQDFDIMLIVNEYEAFIREEPWISSFGKPVLSQRPDEMFSGKKGNSALTGFHHLMIFEDGNRIDLTVFPFDRFDSDYMHDSLTEVWLDKDGILAGCPPPSDADYHIKRPEEKEFLDVCNEFWWVSTYVAKGIARNEITYAKEMMETAVRPMFMKLIEWEIGMRHDFNVSFGKGGRFMKQYLPGDIYQKVLSTYSGSGAESNRRSLMLMAELFTDISNIVADRLGYSADTEEQAHALQYLKKVCAG